MKIKCWCAREIEGNGFVIRQRKLVVSSNLTTSSIDFNKDFNASVAQPGSEHRSSKARVIRSNRIRGTKFKMTCKKRKYDLIDAMMALADCQANHRKNNREENRYYFCKRCQGYHLTSQKRKETKNYVRSRAGN